MGQPALILNHQHSFQNKTLCDSTNEGQIKKMKRCQGGERREEVHGEGKEELSFKKNIRRRDSVDLKSPICEDTLLLSVNM